MELPNETTKIKHVFFDFDGTIADTFLYYYKILAEMCPEYKLGELTNAEIETLKNSDYKSLLKKYRIPLWKSVLIAIRVKRKLTKDIDQILLFPGIKALITNLVDRGYFVSIVSINSQKNISKFLAKENMTKFITNIWQTSLANTKGRTLKNVLDKYNIKPQQVFFVGDEVRDVSACKANNIKIIAVTWGFNSELALTNARPDFLARNIAELGSMLDSL